MAIAALVAVMVAACSSTGSTTVESIPSSAAVPTSTPVVQTSAHGVVAAIEDIPWSQVGPGWMLATWNPATPMSSGADAVPGEPTPYDSADTLYLINPQGGRYAITTFAPPNEGQNGPALADWSGDGKRALFYSYGPGPSTAIIEVDLHTGERTTFTDRRFDGVPRYSRPNGKAILLLKSKDADSPASLVRVDLAGNHQLTYPVEQVGMENMLEYLFTSDGTQLVLSADSGLALMGNDGRPQKALPVPGQGNCTPTRWWDADSTVTVASCHDPQFTHSQLWLVPIDGATPTPLTAPNDGQRGEVLGAETAWQLTGATFVQAYDPCGYKFLAKLDRIGETPTPVSVPDVDDRSSVDVIGVNGNDLELQTSLSCGSGQSLISYNPTTGSSTVLLGAPVNGGGVIEAIPYPGQE